MNYFILMQVCGFILVSFGRPWSRRQRGALSSPAFYTVISYFKTDPDNKTFCPVPRVIVSVLEDVQALDPSIFS